MFLEPILSAVKNRNSIQFSYHKYKDEEKEQKAPPTLPFELEHITAKMGDTFVSLTEIRRMLDNVRNNASVDDTDVKAMQDKIDQINNLVLELPEQLAKLSI